MRHGSSSRRQRGNRGNGGRRGNSNRAQVFDSNGPDVRIRGTAHQVCEKYLALAKDAAASGDVVLAESYSQHAEHYQRIVISYEENKADSVGENQEHTRSKLKASEKVSDEDLSLPASILGDEPKVENEKMAEA